MLKIFSDFCARQDAGTPSGRPDPSSRAEARDLGKISPGVYPELGRRGGNDNAFFFGPFDVAQDMLCAFARDIPSLVAPPAALAKEFFSDLLESVIPECFLSFDFPRNG